MSSFHRHADADTRQDFDLCESLKVCLEAAMAERLHCKLFLEVTACYNSVDSIAVRNFL